MRRLLASLLLLGAAWGDAEAWQTVKVPSGGGAIMVDGFLDAAEWAGAKEVEIEGGIRLLVKQRAGEVHLGFRMDSPTPRPVDVYLIPADGGIHQIHASMATGERLLPGTPWSDEAVPWQWHTHPDWTANDAEFDTGKPRDLPFKERLVPYEGVEFQVRRSRFAGREWRVMTEVGDFVDSSVRLVYPAGATRDDVSGWAVFVLEDA